MSCTRRTIKYYSHRCCYCGKPLDINDRSIRVLHRDDTPEFSDLDDRIETRFPFCNINCVAWYKMFYSDNFPDELLPHIEDCDPYPCRGDEDIAPVLPDCSKCPHVWGCNRILDSEVIY